MTACSVNLGGQRCRRLPSYLRRASIPPCYRQNPGISPWMDGSPNKAAACVGLAIRANVLQDEILLSPLP